MQCSLSLTSSSRMDIFSTLGGKREPESLWVVSLQEAVEQGQRGTGRKQETSQRKRHVFKDVSRAEKKGAPKPDLWMAAQGAEVLTVESGDT